MTPAREPCRRCKGTGVEFDHRAIGQKIRHQREASGLSLRDLGKRLKLSPAYISDLELGRRGWTPERQRRFLEAMK